VIGLDRPSGVNKWNVTHALCFAEFDPAIDLASLEVVSLLTVPLLLGAEVVSVRVYRGALYANGSPAN
jgi:hypothetical protein